MNDRKRTVSDRKYRPLERGRYASRYGQIEQALIEIKKEGIAEFKSADVANRTKHPGVMTVANILRFTKGVKRKKKERSWEFTEDPIRVENE